MKPTRRELVEIINRLLPLAEARLGTLNQLGPRKRKERSIFWERATGLRDVMEAHAIVKKAGLP